MPLLRHAKKKQRQDKKRTIENKKVKDAFKKLVKKAKIEKTPKALSEAFSGLDKAAKKNLIHKNKAARMKSSLTKFVASDKTVSTVKAVAKKKKSAAVKKTSKTGSKKSTSKKK
jgi:small subunit ribosomal protein S20